MPDEPLTPDVSDQTDLTEVPEQSELSPEESGNWEQRYKDTQAEFTKSRQELATLKQEHEAYQQYLASLQNSETQAEALRMLGLELDSEEDPYAEQPSEVDGLRAELDEMKQWRAQQTEQRELAQLETEIHSGIKEYAGNLDFDVPKGLENLIYNNVLAMAPKPDGSPDIEGAFAEVTGIRDQWIKDYRSQKRRAPSAPIPGTPGAPDHKFGDAKSRLQLANAIAEEAQQAAGH